MERKKALALIKLVEDNKPGIVEKCFKEPVLADKHLLWEQILLFCIKNNIKGDKFNKFISICCSNKLSKIIITKTAIEAGMYSKKLIDLNLSLDNPVPFIDERRSIFEVRENSNKINHKQQTIFMAKYFSQKNVELYGIYNEIKKPNSR